MKMFYLLLWRICIEIKSTLGNTQAEMRGRKRVVFSEQEA
jgi:hypothetical protein